MAKEKKECNCGSDSMTSLAGVICGCLIAMIAIVVIFVPSQAGIITPIAISMAVLGIGLGYFRAKKC